MSGSFFQNAALRATLIGVYRLYARAQLGRTGPRVFVNSIPKAGTHLLTSELVKHPALQYSGLWVRGRHVNALAEHGERLRDFELDQQAFVRHLGTVRNGQFFVGHLAYSEMMMKTLRENDVRAILMIRHPLDVIVSRFHYICGLKRHSKHEYFMNVLKTDAERIDVLINGNDGDPPMRSLGEQLQAFEGWLHAPDVLVVRFEDLVGATGGGDDELRDLTLSRIMAHIGIDPAARRASPPNVGRRSATFRKGRIHGWSELLDAAAIDQVGTQFAGVIASFGYEIGAAPRAYECPCRAADGDRHV